MRIFNTITISLLSILVTSCGHFIYKSVNPKTPLLSEKNDFVGQVSLSGGGSEVYAAYSPIKYLGLSAAYAGYKQRSDSSNFLTATKFRDYEFALNPYFSLNGFVAEMPLGIGLTERKSVNNTFKTYSPYDRYFLQPTFGYKQEYIELALFTRITQVDYENERWGIDYRYEPGFSIKGGAPFIKFMFQFRLNIGTNYSYTEEANLKPEDQVEYYPFHIGLGISSNLNFTKKSKEHKKD